MLFTCAPRAAAATRPASRKIVKRGNRSFAVDLHCHVDTPAADELAKKSERPAVDPLARYRNPRTQEHQQKLRAQLDRKLTSIEQRVSDMDKMGIDVQAISTSPMQYYYALEADLGRQISRAINERLAEIVASRPDRFVALSHIVFGGVLERHPGLKFVAAHGGGYLSHYPARMDHAYKVRPECHDHIKRPPSFYMKKIYFDTMVFGRAQLEHLVRLWGAGRVVIGTDYPYDMGYYKPVEFVNAVKSLTRAQKDAIIGGNAARLLKIKRRAGARKSGRASARESGRGIARESVSA